MYRTLKVPRSNLNVFTNLTPAELGRPTVHCILKSGRQSSSKWQDVFADVHLVFGNIVGSGESTEDQSEFEVVQDTRGWEGNSSLVVSFCAPSWVVLREPYTATVSFGVQCTPQSTSTFFKPLGIKMNAYTTQLTDNDHVFITEFRPKESGYRSGVKSARHGSAADSPGVSQNPHNFTANMDSQKAQIVALTGRIENLPADFKTRLKESGVLNSRRLSPFTLGIHIGGPCQFILNFPAPVHAGCNLDIESEYSYIDVITPVADHINSDGFSDFMYPSFIHEIGPVLWNMPCVNLEHLPIIDTTKKADLGWLFTLFALQFSIRELRLRERAITEEEDHGDVRIHFKDSIRSLFMHFTDLEGKKINIFGLINPGKSRLHIVIFVASLRLDMANHSVLDTAILSVDEKI
ncbi:hypothetical protein BJ875DRAFT_516814 [Amylocarpus encephaloides]|uniref:Uncharacterized protein n=1 Tax=Amylocarpus encephaloides TaxID=45428 RepID=A0A9P8C2L0_9HELO|nr:hypothetical protein BJ875DRAFT_516814 [Amylocarpus encephaloides]